MLRLTLIGLRFKGIPKSHSESIEKLWCKFRDENKPIDKHNEDFQRKDCIERICKRCGVKRYEKQLNSSLLDKETAVCWKQWSLKKTGRMSKKGKVIKRMGLCEFSGTPKVLFKEYLKRFEKMSLHQFIKIWQIKKFKEALYGIYKLDR